ncbi:precorrin-2 dehydrogenase / sirohydrochlorin ferrochelatase [Halobiforma haloterrestris]|uniref:precorrin-2 dehydrogenase n=1 Tax=Natronobacterium haloterrestre TaxID=148448 RepID=A0A1I1ED21_NATHA|nr:bifunctional precorrin-2 dehydrogenase/sirohydrochlorin ferrochelatase [Halobiforma haloterrestris]SFB84995.1 precorrin-2 dehydrogenase / sirohydrochlorin ferrochelatase [Halobiforma haloterrestris]
MIPLGHDFTDATVLVFGGGSVGARKARRFAREAEVIVVSPAFTDAFEEVAVEVEVKTGNGSTDRSGTVSRIRAAPDPDEVGDWLERTTPTLVVAATDDETLNDAIGEAARERGALVNRADRSGTGDGDPGRVVVPATVREDPVVVAVATGGTAPAVSKYLREELEETLAGAGEMATLCGELRTELRSRGVSPERRREVVTDVTRSPEVWTTLRSGDSNRQQVIEDVLGEQLDDTGTGMGGDRE